MSKKVMTDLFLKAIIPWWKICCWLAQNIIGDAVYFQLQSIPLLLLVLHLEMKAILHLFVVAAIATVTRGDVSGTSPERNTCFCFNGYSVNIRSTGMNYLTVFIMALPFRALACSSGEDGKLIWSAYCFKLVTSNFIEALY